MFVPDATYIHSGQFPRMRRPSSPAGPKTLLHIHLSPETVLQLAPGVRTRFDAGGHVLLDAPDGTVVDIGPRGFAILSLFSQPLTLGDAIERLEHEAPLDRLRADDERHQHAASRRARSSSPTRAGPTSGWADPVEHARMLHDDRRTATTSRRSPRRCGRDDVVLDIGTGSGVLAIAAARAGARHVYAVEASDIAEVAERVFAANGVQDTVTLLPGWSRQIELPEPADLLVAEVIGNEPLEEEILETTLDARRRLLKPGARLIPHALTLLARPLLLPEDEARQRAIGRDGGRALAASCTTSSSSRCSTPRSRGRSTCPPRPRWPRPGRPSARRSSSLSLDLTTFEEPRCAPRPTSSSTRRAR